MISRRTEELYSILDAGLDDGGLFDALVLPLRDIVLYPKLLTPLFVVHEPSLLAVEAAIRSQETMIGIALTDPDTDNPGPGDFYAVGTEIAVGRLMHLPDGSISIMAQGRRRLEIIEIIREGKSLRARARPIVELVSKTNETLALMRAVLTLFEKCVELNRSLPEEVYLYAVNIEDPGWLADLT
ncbi:MAG: LON peptidase substrate-binding domain-containing protein, partial [Anaerolineales bacterium]|nr:LON peptidase substrate-binding domain-containing protein [Anaerolineales bacterium]